MFIIIIYAQITNLTQHIECYLRLIIFEGSPWNVFDDRFNEDIWNVQESFMIAISVERDISLTMGLRSDYDVTRHGDCD
jgi:hypothetical protein